MMEKIKIFKVTVQISYTDGMTLDSLEDSLHTLNEAFTEFHQMHCMGFVKINEIGSVVKSVTGSILTVGTVLKITDKLLEILLIILKNKFKEKELYKVDVNYKPVRMSWSEKDTYELIKGVLKEYVLDSGDKSINDFIDDLWQSMKYSKGSLRMKIQNTKQLIEEKQISNNLKIKPLSNYSDMHKKQFDKACNDLKIIE